MTMKRNRKLTKNGAGSGPDDACGNGDVYGGSGCGHSGFGCGH